MQPWQSRSMEFHPYMVKTVDALPGGLRAAAKAALLPGDRLVSAFVVPPEFRATEGEEPQAVPEQALLFTGSGAVHIQAPLEGAPAASPAYLRPEKLLWMRSHHLLLYGRLEFVSAAAGQASKLEMEFNAIGWRLMQPEWHALVEQAIGITPPAVEEEQVTNEQERLLPPAMPEKFLDGVVRYGLYTGENLLGAVFQPEVWKQNLFTFDEQLVPNTLVALTAASVLIVAEEPVPVRDSDVLGLIITRIPRRAIADVEAGAQDRLQEIRFHLACDGVDDARTVLLSPEIAQSWLELWNRP